MGQEANSIWKTAAARIGSLSLLLAFVGAAVIAIMEPGKLSLRIMVTLAMVVSVGGIYTCGLLLAKNPAYAITLLFCLPPLCGGYWAGMYEWRGSGALMGGMFLAAAIIPIYFLIRSFGGSEPAKTSDAATST